jgi:hypothetical protein
MICAQCGATSDEGQRFCYNCGARLVEPASQPVMAPPAQSLPTQPSPAPLQPAGYQTPGAYPPASVGYGPQVIPNSPLAITSLISGIITWVVLPFVGAIVAIVTGHMARNEIRRSGGRMTGDGMAIVGMILGYTQIALTFLGACFFLFVIAIAS